MQFFKCSEKLLVAQNLLLNKHKQEFKLTSSICAVYETIFEVTKKRDQTPQPSLYPHHSSHCTISGDV